MPDQLCPLLDLQNYLSVADLIVVRFGCYSQERGSLLYMYHLQAARHFLKSLVTIETLCTYWGDLAEFFDEFNSLSHSTFTV